MCGADAMLPAEAFLFLGEWQQAQPFAAQQNH